VDPDDLADLLRRAQANDRDAAELLFSIIREYVRYQADRRLDPRLRRKFDPEDVIQSVERELFENLNGIEFRGLPHFYAYLSASVEHKIAGKADFWRAQRRDVDRETPLEPSKSDASGDGGAPLVATDTDPAEHAQEMERNRIIASEIERLSEPERSVLKYYREKLTDAQIGAKLHLKGDQVRYIRKQAFKTLRPRIRARLGTRPPSS
jgi:RNA polymerase sigma factor (sigma-70 family)